MPHPRMRPKVIKAAEAVRSRLLADAMALPAEGLSGADFERRVMSDVDPVLVAPVIEALHRKGAIWVSRNRGALMVYGSRPEAAPRVLALDADAMDAFLGSALPHARRAAKAVEARSSGDGKAAYALEVEAGRIVRAVLRHASKGLQLADMRAELWAIFPTAVMLAVAYSDPRLQRESTATEIGEVRGKPKRIASGLPLDERIAAYAAKYPEGVTRTDLARAIRPLVPAEEMQKALRRLEADGRLCSETTKGQRRPLVRWRVES